MKNLLTVCLILSVYIASAQGPQTLVDVPHDSYPGANVKGWLYLPADYQSSNKKYPVVIFYHGVGEAGNNPQSVLWQGLPQMISNGMRPDNITNPVDGQKYSFIVLSVQHWSWSPDPLWLPYQLKWLKENYRIDTSRVYVTGLSSGGANALGACLLYNDVSKLITAAVPMSAGQVWPYSPALIAQNQIKTWIFSGNNDGNYTTLAQMYNSHFNLLYPNSSKLTLYNGNHCCWNDYYNVAWHDPVSGLSIWEWMLQYQRGTPTSSVNQPPVVNAGSPQIITLPTSNISLNGSATDVDGSVTTYAWTKVSGGTATFGSPNSAITSVSGLAAGTYTFRLTATDNQGASSSDDVVVTVNAASTSGATSTVRIEAESYTAMSGVQKETTYDVGGGQGVGYQDQVGDYMDYTINIAQAGTYALNFRVATINVGVQFQLRKPDGTVLSTVTAPSTGGWQTWTTVASQATFAAGTQTVRIYTSVPNGGWNLNWWEIGAATSTTPPPVTSSTRIQAESYTSQSGTQLDASTDVGGTQYVGWTEPGDWMDYAVNVATSGTYTVSFRVATAQASQIQLRKADGSVLSTLALPSTGGWQSWQTVTAQVTLAAGQQTLRIYANTSGWNINWWELEATGSTTPATPTTPAVTTRVEAENYSSQSGTQLDAATDAGGTLYVGWTETGDWMDYAVNVATSGTYTVSFRVATIQASQIQLRKADGSVLATVSLPNTGGWQTWQTVTAQVSLTAGSQTLRIHALTNGWNINWWELTPNSGTTPASPYYVKIEAESYGNMSGVQKEGTSDIGGGQDVGYQDDNDWMDYSVNIPASGTYTLNFRVATISVNTQFQLRAADGKVLTTVNVPSTGGWQTWTTTSAVVTLPAGQQTLRIFTSRANGGWNINWWEITSTTQSVTSARSLATEEVAAKSDAGNDGVKVNLYPNPVQDRFSLSLAGNEAGAVLVEIYSVDGKLEKTYRLQKANAGAMQFYLSAQGLTKGQHIVSIRVNKAQVNTTMIKL